MPTGFVYGKPSTRRDSGFSPEAQIVGNVAATIIDYFEQSQALFGKKAGAISLLRALAKECSRENWDGYGATAIDPQAILIAEDFIRALPRRIPLPEFAPEPDGSVSLDWIRSQNHLFSISVNNTGRLAFAWIDGSDKGHGVANFDGGRIPDRILLGIDDIVSYATTPFRVA